jgi:hypothetical protein
MQEKRPKTSIRNFLGFFYRIGSEREIAIREGVLVRDGEVAIFALATSSRVQRICWSFSFILFYFIYRFYEAERIAAERNRLIVSLGFIDQTRSTRYSSFSLLTVQWIARKIVKTRRIHMVHTLIGLNARNASNTGYTIQLMMLVFQV